MMDRLIDVAVLAVLVPVYVASTAVAVIWWTVLCPITAVQERLS